MWSGPRNISTAMMRAWENRTDTFVTDEPFYAYYLHETGIVHPGRDEVIQSQSTDWQQVAAWITGSVPNARRIWYQKHMAHHLLPHMGREWLGNLSHGFLIREPREMLTSLVHNLPEPTVSDTGLPQQVELLELLIAATGQIPPVVDARDVLENPAGMLQALCAAFGVPFEERMLSWPPGRRETDGVWAPHWYAAVERSTGFQAYRPKPDPVPPSLEPVLAECELLYARLSAYRLVPAGPSSPCSSNTTP